MNYTVSGKGSYLLVPVWAGEEEKAIKITVDGGSEMMIMLPIASSNKKPSYSAPVAVVCAGSCAQEHTAVLSADVDLKAVISQFVFSDSVPEPEPQKCRPLCHFAAKTGWINDPNGMVFKDGVYHLYFQYNPFNTKWENMCWGHAESRDLLHWEQKDTVLFPSENAHIFSGSGIQNNHSLLNLPESALIFFYTYAAPRTAKSEAERAFSQKIAYSTDSGRTFQKMEGDFLPTICADNRDPKVFYHSPTQAYICVLWLKKSTYALFRSTDLKNWRETQRISLEPAWECPDLFELECGETHEKKWVFWSADGYYWVGNFDGYRFEAEQDMQKAYLTKLPYAAQTFSGLSERVVSIAWLRTENRAQLFRGVMSLPRCFSLVKKGSQYLLSQRAAEQWYASLKKIFSRQFSGSTSFSSESAAYLIDMDFGSEEAEYTVSYGGKMLFSSAVFGNRGGKKHIQLFIDGCIAELTNSDCTAIAHFELDAAECESAVVALESSGECGAALYSVGN